MDNYFNLGNEGFHCTFLDNRIRTLGQTEPLLDYHSSREQKEQKPGQMLPPALEMIKAASRSRLRKDSESDSEGSLTKSPPLKEARETSPETIELTKEDLDQKAGEITEGVIGNIKEDSRNIRIVHRYENFKSSFVRNPSAETKDQLSKATKLMHNYASNLLQQAYVTFCHDPGYKLSSEMATSLADKVVGNLPRIINQLTRS